MSTLVPGAGALAEPPFCGRDGLWPIPSVGFGTAHLYESHIYQALRAGVRHLDCARLYANEQEVGEALRRFLRDEQDKNEHGRGPAATRGDVWITSKLWCEDHRPARVVASVAQSLRDLQTDYLDLLLIHWPRAFVPGRPFVVDRAVRSVLETWEAMEALVREGKVRFLGVSNFDQAQVEELLAALAKRNAGAHSEMDSSQTHCRGNRDEHLTGARTLEQYKNASTSWCPILVNQIELHPGFQQAAYVAWLRSRGIVPVAWGPLNFGRKRMSRNDGVLAEVARKHDATIWEVALRWNVQRGVVIIPSSTNRAHVVANLNAGAGLCGDANAPRNFQLDADDMGRIGEDCESGSRRFPDVIGMWPETSGRLARTAGKVLEWYLDRVFFPIVGAQDAISWRRWWVKRKQCAAESRDVDEDAACK